MSDDACTGAGGGPRGAARRGGRRSAVLFPILLLFLVAALPGCGNVTAGGFGETTILVSGDTEGAQTLSGSAMLSPSRLAEDSRTEATGAGGPVAAEHAGLAGTVEVRLRVSLLTDTGSWMNITREEQAVEVDLAGEFEEEVATAELQPGVYDRIRVTFTHISADVERGASSEAPPTPHTVEVDLSEAGGEIVVEEEVFLLVQERTGQDILIDLASRRWAALANVPEQAVHAVAPKLFRDAVRILVRDPPPEMQ